MTAAIIERDLSRSLAATLCCLLVPVHIASQVSSVLRDRLVSRDCRVKSRYKFRVLLFPVFGALAACGGGDGGGSRQRRAAAVAVAAATAGKPGFSCLLRTFDAMCAAPRPAPADRRGTATDENNWLRSWTNELYLWYGEVTDRDPASIHHRLFPPAEDQRHHGVGPAQGQVPFHLRHRRVAGAVAGRDVGRLRRGVRNPRAHAAAPYRGGLHRSRLAGRRASLLRGDEILQVDGEDAVNGNTQAVVDTLNAGLFPDNTGETHTFMVRSTAGAHAHGDDHLRQHRARSGADRHDRSTPPSGPVGYIQFNDHIATAERRSRTPSTTCSTTRTSPT